MSDVKLRHAQVMAKLTQSRQAICQYVQAESAGGQGIMPKALSALLHRLFGSQVAPFLLSSLGQAWRRHPARQSLQLVHGLLEQPVRTRPLQALLIAAALGAGLYSCKPCRRLLSASLVWRFASRSLNQFIHQLSLDKLLSAAVTRTA